VSHYPGQAHDTRWRSLVFPEDHINPRAKSRYHLVVIGAGPAGLICAIGAAGLGARVALIERQAMGGDCLNVGCVPSKALLEYTNRHSIDGTFEAAFAWMREVRAGIAAHDSVQRYTDLGVDVFLGEARFVDGSTVAVDDQELSARRIVIATGARAALPGIPGLDESDPLTNETVFDLRQAPNTIAIVGAGPVGCELGQALARLGVAVHLFDVADRVLPNEEADAADAVSKSLLRSGVTLHLGADVSRVERTGDGIRIAYDETELHVDRALVAAGRQANTERLNLSAAGVDLAENGLIEVDDRLRTTNSRIYAAGDVCSRLQFTHHADAHARIVIQNALFAPTARTSRLVIPHCIYTNPELAYVGRSAAELERNGTRFDRYAVRFGELDRGRAAGDEDSYAALLVDPKRGNILGATVVAENAGDLIAPICLAMSNGLRLGDVGKAVYPYPTRSEYLRRLSDNYNRTRLTPTVKRLMQTWLRLIN
jgi:pyruvate/2-oxoglutarate dehydrogenase complex dihydrolipoamide dehydrogenase (E3) component